ncbi:MAG: glycosyltransferase family 25 protein [Nitrosomonas sp.]|nr:glycosyltransferase family 25 protein [Nitrosomonas sp.]
MDDKFALYSFKKVIRSNWINKSRLGKFLFPIKNGIRKIFSVFLLFIDHILFIFKQDNIKSLYRQSEFIHFETHCINLIRRLDKKKFIADQFDNVSFNLKFFPAVDGATLNLEQLIKQGRLAPDNRDLGTGNKLTPAQIGVYLSHYELWKEALNSSNKITFILEDDAFLDCEVATLQKVIHYIPEDTDIFFVNHRKNKKQHINPYISKFVGRFWGLTSYFVTKKGAEKLLQLTAPIHMSVDDMVSRLNEKGLINCYCSRQELVIECSNAKDRKNFRFASDIQDRTEERD